MLFIRPIRVGPLQSLNGDVTAPISDIFIRSLPLQQTVLPPLTPELLWYEWKVWYPQQAAHKVRSRGIKKWLALQRLPVLCICDKVGFERCRSHTR